MIGDYVFHRNLLARITDENFGVVTIKVINDGTHRDVWLSSLRPSYVQPVIGQSSNGRTQAFGACDLGSNPS